MSMLPADDLEAPLLPRRRLPADIALDITPMIDVTFLLLIFFLVARVPDVRHALHLPPARHGVAVRAPASTVITVADDGTGRPLVYLSDGKVEGPLEDDAIRQEAAVREYVERGRREGKTDVIVKAEGGLRHGDVARIAAIAGGVEGVSLNVAVMEVK